MRVWRVTYVGNVQEDKEGDNMTVENNSLFFWKGDDRVSGVNGHSWIDFEEVFDEDV